jgi:hypothetical protein
MPTEDTKPDRYLSWIDTEIKIYEAYHNAKETKAWAAVAAYIPAVIILGRGAGKALRYGLRGWLIRVALTIVFVVAWKQVKTFVDFQFDKRREADRTTRGLRRARNKLLTDPSSYTTTDTDRVTEDWPPFIAKEIEAVPDEPERYNGTERPSRALLLIGTLIAIGALLFTHAVHR